MECPGCFSRGAVYDNKNNKCIICVVCKGSGEFNNITNYNSIGITHTRHNCNNCNKNNRGQVAKKILLSDQCTSCDGNGFIEKQCPMCFGTGNVTYTYKKRINSGRAVKFFMCFPYIGNNTIVVDDKRIYPCGCNSIKRKIMCKDCDGSGKLSMIQYDKCTVCDGTGTLIY
jgi:DnaJ-class molecular chaperone